MFPYLTPLLPEEGLLGGTPVDAVKAAGVLYYSHGLKMGEGASYYRGIAVGLEHQIARLRVQADEAHAMADRYERQQGQCATIALSLAGTAAVQRTEWEEFYEGDENG